MKSAIEQILSGDATCENIEIPRETNKTSREAVKVYEKLKGMLNEKQKELLEKYLELDTIATEEIEEEYYKHGFKLGLMIGAEVFLG